MLVGVDQVVKVKATGILVRRRLTSTILNQKTLMATKLIKINATRKPSKSTATSMKTCVKEITVVISTTQLTEILNTLNNRNNAQALEL
jgi:hypothetical protein